MRKLSNYLEQGRLSDVLALIQVLALGEHTHRSEKGLVADLQGQPSSSTTWSEIAKEHPEFFRFNPAEDKTHQISLISRHILPGDDDKVTPEYTEKLLRLAIELHDRQMKRSEEWKVWVPTLTSIAAAIIALCK